MPEFNSYDEFKSYYIHKLGPLLYYDTITLFNNICLFHDNDKHISEIFDTTTMSTITYIAHTQHNSPRTLLRDCSFDDLICYPIFAGHYYVLFHHHLTWYISNGINMIYPMTNKTNRIIMNIIDHMHRYDHTYEMLNRDNIYHIILNDYTLTNTTINNIDADIIHNYNNDIFTMMITHDNNIIDTDILRIPAIRSHNITNYDDLMNQLTNISDMNRSAKRITYEGYYVYNKTTHQIYRFNTRIYDIIMNNLNDYPQYPLQLLYIALFHDKRTKILTYTNESANDIINRIDKSMTTMARELLNIYHVTRNKKNDKIYNIIPVSYKKILYEIHGQYINNKEKRECPDSNIRNNKNNYDDIDNGSISLKNIINYLYKQHYYDILVLFCDRLRIYTRPELTEFMINDCIYMITQMKIINACNHNI